MPDKAAIQPARLTATCPLCRLNPQPWAALSGPKTFWPSLSLSLPLSFLALVKLLLSTVRLPYTILSTPLVSNLVLVTPATSWPSLLPPPSLLVDSFTQRIISREVARQRNTWWASQGRRTEGETSLHTLNEAAPAPWDAILERKEC
jgi:hypothetical protein